MSKSRIIILTLIAMIAFAGNSLLCRLALKHTNIDAASFTFIRLISGAVMFWTVIRLKGVKYRVASNWRSALGLFVYAAGFSFAYVRLPTAIGALLLFGAVQITMIGYGVWAGERLLGLRLVGVMLALGGLVGLLLPDQSAPPLNVSLLMLVAGVAWGSLFFTRKKSG